MRLGTFTRFLSSSTRCRLSIVVTEEIKAALRDKLKPIISLESTIITHGLPYPKNLDMAKKVETIVRNSGGIPATCAFIKGKPYVGLNEKQLEYLALEAKTNTVNKVSRRDIGSTMANRLNGGTTIALTMILSHKAGIKVFATGGLGGVHRHGQTTMDISADLTELGRTPVTVVCAGPKSILDIGLTMEYLETQGVYVGTYNDDGRSLVEVPGFYCRESGIISPYSFNDYAEVAAVIHNQNNVMNLHSGNVICIPPPKETALDSKNMEKIIKQATEKAIKQNISGKQLTPFLLSQIADLTDGKSVECNINFVYNNAKSATKIAKELLKLETVCKI